MITRLCRRGEGWRGAVVLLAFGACAAPAAASDDAEQLDGRLHEVTVVAERFQFTPSEIVVAQGETVRLTFRAVDVPHGIVIAALGVRAVARPGQEAVTVEFVADTPGRYPFACSVFCGSGHGEMRGVLTVTPAGGADAPDGPDRVADLEVDVVEPDFNLITLPTTLRLPRNAFAFRLTHRFSRPLDGGPGYGNLLEDFFGFDSPALIGLELRYGLAPGVQVGVYRNNNRNVQIFGRYNLLWQRDDSGIGLDAYVSVEAFDNFRQEYSPAVGAVFSKRLSERGAVYVEPIWIGNANKALFHPEPGFASSDEHSLVLGLGSRIRVLDTVYMTGEYVPRLIGFDNGDHHVSVGVEKRAGGHLFQVNISNGLGATPAQVAQGADNGNWYIGFNIARKFY